MYVHVPTYSIYLGRGSPVDSPDKIKKDINFEKLTGFVDLSRAHCI